MANVEREAHVVWEGDLAQGSGTLSEGSGVLQDAPVTFASRVQRPDGKTSPEELIAGAHATCYAMALSNTLAENGTAPDRLEVDAVCVLDDEQLKITTMDLNVQGTVSGMSQESSRTRHARPNRCAQSPTPSGITWRSGCRPACRARRYTQGAVSLRRCRLRRYGGDSGGADTVLDLLAQYISLSGASRNSSRF